MGLAGEHLIRANGWEHLDNSENKVANQDYLDFAHKVANVFGTKQGKELLSIFVDRYLIQSFTSDNEPMSLIRKQGRADVIKQILAQIEISKNTK